MTIPASMPIRAVYMGDDVTVNFPVPFKYFANTDGTKQVQVILSDGDGTNAVVLVENTDYTMTEENQSNGTLTMVTAPATGKRITIIYNIPIEQKTDWEEFGRLPSESIENACDKLTAILKQQKEVLDRCVKVKETDTMTGDELRDAIFEAKDTAETSAALAHDWAVKMDGKVAGEDYSAKYYAEQAADVPYNGVIATGGTAKRSLQNHFGDILNVKDFGAKDVEKVELIVVAGQSNAKGLSEFNTPGSIVADGEYYNIDYNMWHKNIQNPVSPSGRGGFIPAMAKKINQTKNRLVYIINVSVSSSNCANTTANRQSWGSDGLLRARALEIINKAIKTIDRPYEFLGTIWLQGEADAYDIKGGIETLEQYNTGINETINFFLNNFGGKFFAIPIAYNSDNTYDTYVDSVNSTLSKNVNSIENATIITDITKSFRDDEKLRDFYHYYQSAYDELGVELGTKLSPYISVAGNDFNSTQAFKKASKSGKTVFIPDGTYKLTEYIDGRNFVAGPNVSFTEKTVTSKSLSNTYKKSIVFSMPREFSAYNDICTAMGETRLWPQGFDYDDDGNCYIAMDGNGTTYTAIIKLDNQYNYVGWIKIPYGTENPTIVNKNSDLLLYIRSAGNARKLTEYDITSAMWNGDYITGTDTAIDYYNTQCDYDNGTWYVLSAEANIGNIWAGRNWIKKYDDDFNYLGYIKLPMEFMSGSNSNKYHYDMIKTQGFRVKDNEIYISHGVGRRFTTIPDYKPSFDFGISHFSADGKTLLQFSLLNEEKFTKYLQEQGYTVLGTETEGLAKHPDGSIHHLFTTDTDMFIFREFDDAGTDFSYMASTYNPVNLDDLQNYIYPVKLDTNGDAQYLDVVSGAQITQVSDFFEMMYNLDLQTLKINTQILNVAGADGLTLPNKSLCVFQNRNNSYIFCSVTPNTGEGAETGILFYKSGSTWIQNNKVKQSTYCFQLESDGTDGNRTYIRYKKGNDLYNPMVISDIGINIGNYSGLYPGAQTVSVYVSNSSQDSYRRVWGANYSALYPGTSNTINLGNANNLWKEIFCANATINTSDERLKQDIEDIDERVFRAWEKVDFKQFRFKQAVNEKGENARIHFGVIAQRVKEAFESEGLDGFKYGLLCYDEWEDEFEENEITDKPAEYDEEGNVTVPAETHIERVQTQTAGNAYGIRYGEALALECAYQRWKLEQLIEQLTTLNKE